MKNSFSVVMPTMGKYFPIWSFIEDLCLLDVVDEIIIINNCLGDEIDEVHPRIFQNPKIRWEGASFGSPINIGCNAAWNKGVSLAKNENICIMNDDIIWDMRAFYRVADTLSEEKPLIGMSAGDPVHHQPPIIDGAIDVVEWKAGMHTHGFGCLFFVRKSWWIPIPEKLWLYYGDNWAFDTTLMRHKPVHLLTNFMYNTPFAVTSSEIGSHEMLMKEHAIYYEELKHVNTD